MISYYLYVTLHYLINLKTYTSAVSIHLQVICREGRERRREGRERQTVKQRQTDRQTDRQTETETE